ncbi:hypothetical protein TSUD_208970 [Trifolium subterraneum]|uniref:Protein kinase domain-containing protein n=1 Tax=Trifolium subterraneum TaxID=3900 RepID=A0A2Z6NMF1_TRISU|nr:hypothetical protein TSUD_208970 [Trifolium subterraneum]
MEITIVACAFLLIFTTFFNPSSLALTQDGQTLLEIKNTFNDTKNVLSNWQEFDESHCAWTGISCHPGDEQRVRSINLPYMQLGGIISPSIGKLSRLQRLDVSSNGLKGSIPSSIGRLSHLQVLNLSTNFFYGEIPDIGVLSTFQKNSYVFFPFPTTKRSSHYMKAVLIGAVATLGLALIITLSLLWIRSSSKKERAARKYTEVKKQVDPSASAKLITFHGDMPYTSSEIIEKLESLDEEDIVGSGGFGTVYRMVMNDCGTFAVKRIDRSREGSDQVFERELEILGSIKHINLVNLRGYCRLPSSRLLIYDYVALGSLDDLLHDVYSFGVLLLELVTGKRPTDPSFVKRGLNVVGWMNTLLQENRLEDVVDRRCSGVDAETLEVILELAARCTDSNADDRPSMNQVLQLLEQEVMSPCPSEFYESHSDH